MKRRLLLLGCLLAVAQRAFADAPALLLAGRYRPGIDLRDWWVSEKYDGVRAHWDGRQLRTRGGERIAAPAWFTAGWPALPMDGELWAGRGRFEHAQSAAAREQPDDAQWRALRYMVVDLPAQAVVRPDGHGIPFQIDAFRKECLLNGWDDIGLTLRHAEKIREFEEKRRIDQPWLFA